MKRTSSATTSSRLGSVVVVVDDLPQYPGVALRAATDHDGGRSRRRENRLGPGARGDVARGDHRHVDERHELGRQRWSAVPVYICCAERGCSVSTDAPAVTRRGPTVEAVARAVSEAAAHLHRHGQLDRVGDGGDDATREVGVVEQRRSGAGLRHLPHRAAEVDVDEVRAGCLDHAGRVCHRGRVGAEDLDRERVLVGGDAEIAERLLVSVLDAGAGDHLGADEPGPEPPSLAPERLHADACHRRQHEARRHLDGADVPALSEIDCHAAMVDGCRLRPASPRQVPFTTVVTPGIGPTPY